MDGEENYKTHRVDIAFSDDEVYQRRLEYPDYFYDLHKEDDWANIRIYSRDEQTRFITTFMFLSNWLPQTFERSLVIDRAFFDMHGWLELVGMTYVEPCIVDVYTNPGKPDEWREDMTPETRGLLQRIGSYRSVSPADFNY